MIKVQSNVQNINTYNGTLYDYTDPELLDACIKTVHCTLSFTQRQKWMTKQTKHIKMITNNNNKIIPGMCPCITSSLIKLKLECF